MTIAISQIRGISEELVDRLKLLGILTSDHLLDAARTPIGRLALAEELGVSTRVIMDLAHRADLARVKGIGRVFSGMLEHAGVDTVRELANRRPDNLYHRLAEINTDRRLAGRMPTRRAVEKWVAQARDLPRLLED
jgi:predicted flap endonuclease-1-like 5' DNA nuclease